MKTPLALRSHPNSFCPRDSAPERRGALLAMVLAGACGTLFFAPMGARSAPAQPSGSVQTRRSTPPQEEDPALARFGLYENTAPFAQRCAPHETRLPLQLRKNDRIALVGNTLLDRAQDFGHLETFLHLEFPNHQLVVRHLAWSADEVALQPRPENFATLEQHLAYEKADVIFAAFGFNESFGGTEKLEEFRENLSGWLARIRSSAFNGRTGPRVVLLSPPSNENIPGIPAADLNNGRLRAYTLAMEEVAREQKVGFVNLFEATEGTLADPDSQLTLNGVHFTREGDALVSERIFRGLFSKSPAPLSEELRRTVVDKNNQFFRRYRPLNSFYYTGGRRKDHGYLDFLPAMRNFELLTANRDKRIWAIAAGQSFAGIPVDDSNLPPLEAVAEGRGANEWLKPADERNAFRVDPRFEVNLFASEEQFPELARPIQMRWDARGRLWVSCSTTYPHVYPGAEPADKIVILEDTDRDGRADTCTVWAEDLHIPLSFELTSKGVIVSEQPHLSLIEDSDGDGKADRREKLLTGFGTEDSHHALHDLVWTPDGDLLMRESIFHNTQVETPYGPVRARNSAWFQFNLPSQRLTAFGSYPTTNPWGVTFDDWGNHVASHPVFANPFHATNPPYPHQHPPAGKIQAYSGVCGHEFVDFPMWPAELQGAFIKVRYKPTNKVEIHQWIEHDDHYEEKFVSDLVFSENLSFIPVDIGFGPRGDLFVCDWYNPIKGHAQYSLRDPRRDRTSGRIWRIVPKGARLQDPPPIADAPVSALLENLKRAEYRYRYWSKRELRARGAAEVVAALTPWLRTLDPADARHRHHQLEALWTFRSVEHANADLLKELLGCEEHHARAAAVRMLRHWHPLFPDKGASFLAAAAADPKGLVRLEALITASYVGTRAAFDAVMPVMHSPMNEHLRYATVSAFGSENLSRHWKTDPAANAMVEAFLRSNAARNTKVAVEKNARTPDEKRFDALPNLAVVEIDAVPERMLFSTREFQVAPGQPVKLIFSKPDLMQHNLLIVRPGALEEVGTAANEMAKDPAGIQKGFVPASDKVLHATKLLEPRTGTVLRFLAPTEPGSYPYVCTFPGHWVIMNGRMLVK